MEGCKDVREESEECEGVKASRWMGGLCVGVCVWVVSFGQLGSI